MEGPNNQLQFNSLKIIDIENDETNNFLFTHLVEYIPILKINYDPIIKTIIYDNSGLIQAISLRKSGKIDTYWNTFLQNTLSDCNKLII